MGSPNFSQASWGTSLAVALHDGHQVRPELQKYLAVSEDDRLREEDPFTGQWAAMADTRIIVRRSRFEIDLNRPREKAIYLKPEDAWGLNVWRESLPQEQIEKSLAQYDAFYHLLEQICGSLEHRFGRFVIFDLYTYNHRRDGFDAPPASPDHNPDINIGTGSMNRTYWKPVVESFLRDLRNFDFLGRQLNIQENLKFSGGHFSRWTHKRFPQSACVLAIEVKKFFMDEWTHQPDPIQLDAVGRLLQSTIPGVIEALKQIESV